VVKPLFCTAIAELRLIMLRSDLTITKTLHFFFIFSLDVSFPIKISRPVGILNVESQLKDEHAESKMMSHYTVRNIA